MGKFKEYDRTYEFVYTDKEYLERFCKLDKISTYKNIPESVDEYRTYFEKTMKNFQMQAFDHLVKMHWLRNRFCYQGKRRDPLKMGHSGSGNPYIDTAYGIFLRHYVGYEFFLFFSHSHGVFRKLLKYIDDIIPDIHERNPFKERIEYPYTYVQFEHMILVYQMDERMDVLQYAENHKMRYTTFFDYVINYIKNHNEKEYRYELVKGTHLFHPYIKDMIKSEEKLKRMQERIRIARGKRVTKGGRKKKIV